MNERLGKTVLHVEGLSKVYGEGPTRLEALKPTTFDAVAGEVVAILGPSGSGKSTLLTIAGLINPPTAGSLTLNGKLAIKDGQPVANLSTLRRQELGYVFQRSNLIPFLNGEENVRLALEIDGVSTREAKERARTLLDSLGMSGRMSAMPAKLSGGEQQRVAIARAMIHQPSVVLADEPTAALDSSRGRQVMELFRDSAHEHGAAVLLVTHDHRTLDLVDRVLEMEDGFLSEQDSAVKGL